MVSRLQRLCAHSVPEDIAATVDYLLKVHNGIAPKDDLDHLGNRRVRVIGELLENQFRMGLFQIRRTTAANV